ncbi:citrate transporter [Deferribacter autotrophicus]|uniref:Citrate transporter n=1 Tax=Deferribacter autotrophicus TaxID=500465 RepID=A0A5A8F3Z3_9BACT|nr:SLC13 family permease [Deferribacter autotrophicus]KAA0258246.1 citrate transporter [Deferribacter autotrophicus]
MSEKMRVFVNKNIIFLPFLILLFFLIILHPEKVMHYPNYVDWKTIVALLGLLIITTGIKESSFLRSVAQKHLRRINNERELALYFILLSSILAMFLTNDIALFIILPLTLSFQELLQNDIKKIIVFEAISVNVGSSLTPIGNPQNLFLWHEWNISFINFIIKMIPLFMIQFLILIAFCWIIFPARRLMPKPHNNDTKINKNLFIFSAVLLLGYILSIEFEIYYTIVFVLFLYLFLFRDVLRKADYALIVLFVVMFIDFHLFSELSLISDFISQFNLKNPSSVFMLSLLSSQLMSNVPASIFMSKFSHEWFSIAYGVNVGGNGIVFASLANIIALRFINKKKMYLEYHKYSLHYLVITGGLIYTLFFL